MKLVYLTLCLMAVMSESTNSNSHCLLVISMPFNDFSVFSFKSTPFLKIAEMFNFCSLGGLLSILGNSRSDSRFICSSLAMFSRWCVSRISSALSDTSMPVNSQNLTTRCEEFNCKWWYSDTLLSFSWSVNEFAPKQHKLEWHVIILATRTVFVHEWDFDFVLPEVLIAVRICKVVQDLECFFSERLFNGQFHSVQLRPPNSPQFILQRATHHLRDENTLCLDVAFNARLTSRCMLEWTTREQLCDVYVPYAT